MLGQTPFLGLLIYLAGAVPMDLPVASPVSVHGQEGAWHEGISPVLLERTFRHREGAQKSAAEQRFTRMVYGYYPYWADADSAIPWEALTHLAYFNVEVNADGSLGDSHGWAERGAALVEAGHDWGVAVTLTATLFDDEAIRTLLADNAARTAAVENLYAMVVAAGGDGINIDFEFVPEATSADVTSPKENFVTFIDELAERFHSHEPRLHVSIATPAIDWGGTYDYSELARLSDGLMIMGYGYHWSGGNPGPVAPLRSSELWGSYSLEWTVLDYLTWGGEENRDKVVLGIPLYGRDWPSVDLSIPGERTASGVAKSMAQCDTLFQTDKLWDISSETPYRLYWSDGQAHQLFCEDLESVRAKLDLVNEYDLGGLMLWDVGKVSGTHGVWSEIVAAYDASADTPGDTIDDSEANRAPVAVLKVDERAWVGNRVVLDGRESTDPDGQSLSYTWVQTAGPTVSLDTELQVMALFEPRAAGTYSFELTVSDGALADSAQAQLEVLEQGSQPDEQEPSTEPISQNEQDAGGCQATPGLGLWLFWLVALARRMRRHT